MRLSYRSIPYIAKMTSTLMQSTWIIAQFRGTVYRLSRPVVVQQKRSKVLKYRGVAYQSIQSTLVRIESQQNLTQSSLSVKKQASKHT
ncbi:MAG: DUF4278 domain-containing protein [Microcoleaceae cyanobacterium]